MIQITEYTIRHEVYYLTPFFGLIGVAMVYSLWYVFCSTTTIFVEQLLPNEGRARDGFLHAVERANERGVKRFCTWFGIDRQDTEGGVVHNTKENAEIMARLDQLEGMLERILAKNLREEEEEIEANFEEEDDHGTILEETDYDLTY